MRKMCSADRFFGPTITRKNESSGRFLFYPAVSWLSIWSSRQPYSRTLDPRAK